MMVKTRKLTMDDGESPLRDVLCSDGYAMVCRQFCCCVNAVMLLCADSYNVVCRRLCYCMQMDIL